ncbi:LytR family transcriptional regulator [Pseudanabaena sp. UWO311]|uniref:LCP family protein n=1 Tax=Pseudanabaena sp. UWO311 TaxID=2487337 RepID=UPI00115BCDC2|nr:LCP family protein [Pseudanabaena sp. UWO311]TYQ26667.1 LytR family transcriptional regulator [Pseudanabaena sp. UWO311]
MGKNRYRKNFKADLLNYVNSANFPRKSFISIKTTSILVTLAAVSALTGAAISKILSSKPLSHASLAHSADAITGIVPANLDRPVNILILGTDNSGSANPNNEISREEALAGNTDTMLLVRLLPDKHEVNILSIPRDTLIDLKGVGIDKINDANVQGGTSLAAESVSQLLNNIQIDRYVRLDTQGFIQLVDALGGIEVNVPKKMDYVDRSQKLQIHFPPGKQKLNGQHLQEYVRFRHDELGDIGRVQRQQSALKAIFSTLIKAENIGKTPKVLEVAQKNVDTDLSIGEMFAIYKLLQETNRQNIHMLMLPGRFSRTEEFPLSYWIKDTQATNSILASFFAVPAPVTSLIRDSNDESNSKNLAINRSQLRIAVVNTSQKSAIANKVIAQLRQIGFYGAYLSDRDINLNAEELLTTQIIAEQGNPEVAQVVQEELGIGQVQISATGDITSDVTIVIGKDINN